MHDIRLAFCHLVSTRCTPRAERRVYAWQTQSTKGDADEPMACVRGGHRGGSLIGDGNSWPRPGDWSRVG